MQATSSPSSAYRACRIGSRGHVEIVSVIEAVSEDDAVKKARRIADGYVVELWHHDRLIARFAPGRR